MQKKYEEIEGTKANSPRVNSSTRVKQGQRVAPNDGGRIQHTSATVSDEPRAKEEGMMGSAASQDLRKARRSTYGYVEMVKSRGEFDDGGLGLAAALQA